MVAKWLVCNSCLWLQCARKVLVCKIKKSVFAVKIKPCKKRKALAGQKTGAAGATLSLTTASAAGGSQSRWNAP